MFLGYFKNIEHTADIAYELHGGDIEDLFLTAAYAWKDAVAESAVFGADTKINIDLNAGSFEILLVDFINELNYYLTVKKILISGFSRLEIEKMDGNFRLDCVCEGSGAEALNSVLKEEIKSATYHKMRIEESGSGYRTMIIFDI